MTCGFTEQVSSLIDGELAPAEVAAVQYHLSSCIECQEAQADFLSFRREIEAYPHALVPTLQDEALARILAAPDLNRDRLTRDSHAIGWRERLVNAFRLPRFAAGL